jgi:tetratricopeptide (TPR) repeat protein
MKDVLNNNVQVEGEAPRSAAAAAKSPQRLKTEAELQQIERRLISQPSSVALRLRRASLLSALGRLVDARNDYIQILGREPHHLEALTNLGCLLFDTGHRSAARIAFKEAVTRHPDDPISRVNLGYFLLDESERLEVHEHREEALRLKHEAREHFLQALRCKADCERAHEGLSYLLADLGDAERSRWHRREAFRKRCVIPLPYRGESAPVTVLQLVSTTGGNVRLTRFLDDRIFQTFVVLPEFYDSSVPLPAHQLVVNAIGDVEVAFEALAAAESVLALTKAPVVNPPSAVLPTSRSQNAGRLSGLPGVVTPITVTLPREQLADSDACNTLANYGIAFPFLLRAPGFHTGQHFVQVPSGENLPAALAELPGRELIAMQYLDARGRDGKSRKYRVMTVGGQIYPLHLAISSNWKIHYFTAEMANSPQHRAEDAAFLENMPDVLGPLAMKALERIQSVLGLDYGGIDFGLGAQGDILLFEANATMVVNPPEPEERWNYRQPAYKKIHAAVQQMLLKKAGVDFSRAQHRT